MGSKTAAREAAMRAGVPVVPGTPKRRFRRRAPRRRDRPAGRRDRLSAAGQGGGGRRRQGHADRRPIPRDLLGAVRAARSEAATAFGDAAVYLERRLARPRHIEVQLLGDHHGTVLPFVERECSIQRRHQKVVEETPSLAVTPALRRAMTAAAAAVARSGRLHQRRDDRVPARRGAAGSIFLEMNTRLQVEHPITEMVTGIDLVRWQIRIARGERLDLDPDAAAGAERPRDRVPHLRRRSRQQFPAVARPHLAAAAPSGPGIRDDSGAAAGLDVPIFYDPMISKLVAWAEDRPRRSPACAARSTNTWSPASGRPCRSSPGCSSSRSSSRAAFTPPISTRC